MKDEIYISYPRKGEGMHTENYALVLERKARFRQRHRALLAAKQRRYRQRLKEQFHMIKHGRIYPVIEERVPHSHLDPIKDFITKGIADAREKVVLQPMACDVRGAKKYDSQQCIIAKALKRVHKPQAVAVGRSLAYAVFNGLAIRFKLPLASRKVVEEFDSHGRVRRAPIELRVVEPSWRLRAQRVKPSKKSRAEPGKRERTKRYGVRAIGGGVA